MLILTPCAGAKRSELTGMVNAGVFNSYGVVKAQPHEAECTDYSDDNADRIC